MIVLEQNNDNTAKQIKLISLKKFCILLFMLDNETITFKTQRIYNNLFCFNNAMNDLHTRGLVKARRHNGTLNEYALSAKGLKISGALHEISS